MAVPFSRKCLIAYPYMAVMLYRKVCYIHGLVAHMTQCCIAKRKLIRFYS